MRPTNALIKAIQQNDPARFHTRVRNRSRNGKPMLCAGCGEPDDNCRCMAALGEEEEP